MVAASAAPATPTNTIAKVAPTLDIAKVASDLAATWAKTALVICGCSPLGDVEIAKNKRRSKYVIHSSESAELVERQLAFRKARADGRKKAQARMSLQMAVAEGFEDRSRWLRIAAVVLLQTYVRLVKADKRAPSYLRDDWSEPDATEFERRCSVLEQRFPQEQSSSIASALRDCHGHGGYAAAMLVAAADGKDVGSPRVSIASPAAK